jgi:pimeloyl-ACP methyl ester carboxylesterase
MAGSLIVEKSTPSTNAYELLGCAKNSLSFMTSSDESVGVGRNCARRQPLRDACIGQAKRRALCHTPCRSNDELTMPRPPCSGVVTLVTLLSCGHDPSPANAGVVASASAIQDAPVVLSEVATPSASDGGTAALPPLAGFFEALPVPNHNDAWLSLPTNATARRPVVVVIHGAGDRPDWQCGGWRRATEGYPFILCPRGTVSPGNSTKTDVRFTHANGPALRAHIDAALEALAARYPDYVDDHAPIVLAGFSLGSYGIVPIAVQEPSRFPTVVLVEGITDGFDDVQARAYARGGGKRVLFGCGQRGCEVNAKAAARRLAQHDGLMTDVVYAPVNHTFDPPLEDAVHGRMPWLVQDDGRWSFGSPALP